MSADCEERHSKWVDDFNASAPERDGVAVKGSRVVSQRLAINQQWRMLLWQGSQRLAITQGRML